MVMVSGPKTMTKRHPRHILKSLGHALQCKADLDQEIAFLMKMKNLKIIRIPNMIKVRSGWSKNYKIEIDEGFFPLTWSPLFYVERTCLGSLAVKLG